MLANLVKHAPCGQMHHVHTMMSSANFFDISTDAVSMGTLQRERPGARIFWEFGRTVRAIQPDIIHAWMYHANFVSILGKFFHVPIVWSIHNDRLRPRTSKRMTRLINRACAALSRRVPEAIVYVSASARCTHEEQGYDRSKGIVIHNGIDLNHFFLPERVRGGVISSEKTTMALIGRYHPSKGHHFLLDVLARHPLRSKLELLFVGAGCARNERLLRHISNLGLGESVHVMDAVPDVRPILSRTDILVLPSREEGLPMVALEAMAMGCIVCAAHVGGIPELHLPEELVFPPEEAGKFARAISAACRMCKSTSVRLHMRKLAEQFDIRFSIEKYDALYKRILADRLRKSSGGP